MKRTAMKVFAALIALCILLGALPISASADARYAATITYNSEYGYARLESADFEGGQYGYLFAFPNDACMVDKITVTNNTTGDTINAYLNRTTTYRDGTVSYQYRFSMPHSSVSVNVKFRPVKAEKQIELICEDDDLGLIRTEDGTNLAIPTSIVRIYVSPDENSVTGTNNVIKSVTCFTKSGVEIKVTRQMTYPAYTIYCFTMPDENVRVSASFAPPAGWRRLQRENAENGELTVPAQFGQVGNDITVTAEPDAGYVINALYYIDRDTGARTNINTTAGQTEYTFKMPDADITVHAHFGLSSDAHTITTSCDGRLGGQINMNTYVAAPGENVSAIVVPYNNHRIKNVVCINKSTGEEMNVTMTGDEYLTQIKFPMPDYDVEIIASYIFPTIHLGDPSIYAYEDKTREKRRADYDEETRTYTIEVFEDTEILELHILRSANTITVSCPAAAYSETVQASFSREMTLSEGTTEMTVLCEVDDPNSGEHLTAEYTLLVTRTRYIPVESIVIENGDPEKELTYNRAVYPSGWLPSVSYYPENAEQKSVSWSVSDNSILRFGFKNPVDDRYYFLPNQEKSFYTRNKSGIVTITATTPDGASATMKVIVSNRAFNGTLTYDPGEGTDHAPTIPSEIPISSDRDAKYTQRVRNTDTVRLNGCTFLPPEGKVFKAWLYKGEEYTPGDRIFLTNTNETVTAVYVDQYTAVWLNGDNSQLDKKTYLAGEAIPTTLRIPVKEADYYNTYTFDKWDEGTIEGKTITYRPLFTTHEKEQSTYLIHVNNLIGQAVTIEVESTDTVAAVKRKLLAADGTPIDEQHLIYNDTLLRDEMTLADYDIHKEAVLDMAHRAAIKTVVWLNAEGEGFARENYYKDEAEPILHAVPEKADDRTHSYTFDQWDEGTINGNIKTYSPLWKAIEKPYYYVYVGYGTADVEYAYPGDTVTLTADDPSDKHRYHAGWKVIGNNVEVNGDSFVMPADHVYVYADYELKKAPDISIDFSAEKGYIGKPLSISGAISNEDDILDVGGEMTVTFSSGAPEAEDAVSYKVPVTHGKYRLDIPAMTTTGQYVWFEYPGEGIYGEAIVSTTFKTYEVSAASVYAALVEQDIKTVYNVGEELNTDNLYIWIYWMDASEEEYPVTPEMVSGFDSAVPGEQTLTVSCPYPYDDSEGDLCYKVTVRQEGSASSDPSESTDPAGTEGKTLLGDADRDGVLTIIDATTIQRYLAHLIGEEDIDLIAADIDDNGVDILDATYIQRRLAHLSADYPVGEYI